MGHCEVTMTTSELIEAIAAKTGVPKDTVALVLGTSHEVMWKVLKTGEDVVLINFGTFHEVTLKRKAIFGNVLGPRKRIRFRVSRRKDHA